MNAYRRRYLGLIWLAIMLASSTAFAQTVIRGDSDGPGPDEGKLKSRLMAREMPYRVILPPNYNNSDEIIRFSGVPSDFPKRDESNPVKTG